MNTTGAGATEVADTEVDNAGVGNAGDAAPAALNLDGVSVRYGGRTQVAALNDVSVTIAAGERVAVVGRSGAGKSTIARLACGLVAPTEGRVATLGVDVTALKRRELRKLRQRLHLVFQDPYQSLHPGLGVKQLVGEPLAIAGASKAIQRDQINDALARVGLTPPEHFLDRRAASLSGGQRQRVAIARALVAAPELILADEPSSMLDASLRATIADLLLELQDLRGAALVFITHDLALARHVADRIIVLANGSVVEDGATEELLADAKHQETRALLKAARHQPNTGR
ncbi:MAG: ABC transporter ATP-binding protein [Acidimicrobiales bacterium]